MNIGSHHNDHGASPGATSSIATMGECPICEVRQVLVHSVLELYPRESFRKQVCQHLFCLECVKSWVAARISDNTCVVRCPAFGCPCVLYYDDIDRLNAPELSQKYRCLLALSYRGRDWTQEDSAFRAWLEANAKQCPSCSVLITRSSGCNHVTCTCGVNFCYACGAVICACLRSPSPRRRDRSVSPGAGWHRADRSPAPRHRAPREPSSPRRSSLSPRGGRRILRLPSPHHHAVPRSPSRPRLHARSPVPLRHRSRSRSPLQRARWQAYDPHDRRRSRSRSPENYQRPWSQSRTMERRLDAGSGLPHRPMSSASYNLHGMDS